MKANRRTLFSWCIYDSANTAFSALFVTFFFPFFIKEILLGNEFHVGLVIGVSNFLSAIFVPVLGALSDIVGRRMPFLIFFTLTCVMFTILVGFVNLPLALLFAVIANFSYQSALVIYDAILPSIAEEKELGRVSGYGVGVGYLGTIFSLGVAFLVLGLFSTDTRPGYETSSGIRAMFPTTGLFFLFFSIPIFIFVKDRVEKKVVPIKQGIINSFRELKITLTVLPRYKGLIPFLVAVFFYNGAINTIILFLFLYIRETLQVTVLDFIQLFLLFSTSAAIGSLLYGRVVDFIGLKYSISFALLLWIGVDLLLLLTTTYRSIVIAGTVGGMAMGSVWTAARPMLIFLSPKEKAGEFFGFRGLVQTGSGILGPILFGFIVTEWNYTYGLVLLLLFFVIGLVILQKVPNTKAG